MVKSKTNVQTAQWKGNIADIAENSDYSHVVEAPVFIMFAEYLGYVTRFHKVAERWCDGKVPSPMEQKVIIIEAACMFRQMCKDYGKDKIAEYYDRYYPIILSEYVEKLAEIVSKSDK